jgi:hypothetical protein
MITPDSFEQFSRDISGAAYRTREISARDLTRPPYDERIFDATGNLRTEQELAAAVLNQAMSDLRRFRDAKDGAGREMYADAVSWFRANNGDWPYSFINVCEVLDLSASRCSNVFLSMRIVHGFRVCVARLTHWRDR